MNDKNEKDSISLNSFSLNNTLNIDLNNFYQNKKSDINYTVMNLKNSIIKNNITNNIGLQYNFLNPRGKGNNFLPKILLNDYKSKIIQYLFRKNEICNNVGEKDTSSFQTSIQKSFSIPLQNKIFFTKNSIEKSSPFKLIETYQNINHENIKNNLNSENNNNQNSTFGNNKQIFTKQQKNISGIKIKFNAQIQHNNIINNNKNTSTDSSLKRGKTAPIFKTKKMSFQIKKEKKLLKKKRRMIKNNKLVFIQLDQGGDNDLENEEQLEENNDLFNLEKYYLPINNDKKSRRSRFRGVSKNGNHWQVLIMVKKKKKYLGSYSNEEEAARIYDKVALKYHGNKAKTNYNYSKEEIEKIILGQ